MTPKSKVEVEVEGRWRGGGDDHLGFQSIIFSVLFRARSPIRLGSVELEAMLPFLSHRHGTRRIACPLTEDLSGVLISNSN
jgi:hypothetical protein